MKAHGHFWCDRCDDPAFGSRCERCHTEARWVPAPVKPLTLRVRRESPVSQERGRALFSLLHQQLGFQ